MRLVGLVPDYVGCFKRIAKESEKEDGEGNKCSTCVCKMIKEYDPPRKVYRRLGDMFCYPGNSTL